jgi:hypothetical protein
MTPTQISNLALSQLPAGSIISLDEDSLQARACRQWYTQVLTDLLERGPWRFSRKLVALAGLDSSDRTPRWLYRYARPVDLSIVLRVYDENVSAQQDYDYIGEFIYTNVLAPKIEYVSTTGSPFFTALFRSALIAALAVPICIPITKNYKRQDQLAQAANIALQRAQAANINEGQPTYGNFVPDVLAARMGLTGLEQLVFESPEAVYPDFDPVGVFDSELDT